MATEFVGIELELRGEEGVYRDLQKIQSLMNSLGGRKKVDAGLQEARRQVIAYRGELEKLRREQVQLKNSAKQAGSELAQQQAKWTKRMASGEASAFAKNYIRDAQKAYDEAIKAVQANQEAQEVAKEGMRDGQQAIREYQQAYREAGKTFQQTANTIASRARQIGGAMQSLGNAMTRVTSPFTRIATGFLRGVGFRALNTMTEGLSKGFSRYDTMKKYPKIMAAFGYSAEEAQKSIDALDQSVRGLPTGLDEIVDLSQRFTATTGDLTRGTKLAIATNNAFLASMSTDTQRYQGMMQLQDVLGGKDMNAREWNSLVSSMTPAIVKMGEAMGYTNKNMNEWIQTVRDGNVDNQDFIDLLIKVGTEGGEVAKMAENAKDTWQAFFANVGNAASRMTAGVIKALDTLTQSLYGKDLNQFMSENVIKGIDSLAKSVQDWIKANPDKIIDFFNSLKRIDFAGFAKGLLEGYGALVKFMQGFSDLAGGKSLKWLGRALVLGNYYGRLISIFGGVVRGFAPLIGKIGALILQAGKFGIFGKITEMFGGVGGKLFGAKKAKDLAETAGSLGKASGGFVTLAKNIGLAAGSIAAIGGAGFVAFRSFKTIVKDLHEVIREINSFSGAELQQADTILFSMAGAIFGFVAAADAIGLAVGSLGAISTLPAVIGGVALAIVGAMTALVAGETLLVFKSFEQATKSLKQGLKNIEELGNVDYDDKKIDTALATMKKIMETFDTSYDSGGSAKEGGVTHSDWSARSNNFKNITKNLAEAVKSVKETMKELDTLPDISEAEAQQATDKVTNIVEKMRDIAGALNVKFDTGLLDFLGGGAVITKGTTSRASSIVANISNTIQTIRNTVDDLKSFANIPNLDKAAENVKEVGTKMGEIFSALNEAFGQEFITDSDGSFVQKTNEGVTKQQTKKAQALKTLFDSYKQTTSAIRSVYEDLVGNKDKEAFNPQKFQKAMKALTDGEKGIVPSLKGLYDDLIDETDGFGKETDVDIAGKMDGFAKAVTSIRSIYESIIGKQGDIAFSKGDLKKKMGNLVGEKGIIAQLKGMYDELINEEKGFGKEGNANYAGVLDTLSKAMTSVKGIYETIVGGKGGSAFNLKEFNKAIKNITGGKKGNGIISQLASMYRDLIDEENGFGKETDIDLADIMTKFDTAITSISNVVNTLKSIGEIKGLDKILDNVTGDNGIMSKIQGLYADLISEESGFGAGADIDLAGLAEQFAQAVTSIKDAVTTLQEIEGIELGEGKGGGIAVVEKIKSLISQLTNAFSTEAIGALQAQIDSFKAAIEAALQSIVDLGTELEIDASVKLAEGFGTSVDAVVNEIDSAATSIKNAWNKIPTSLSKTITITIKYKKNIDSFPKVSMPLGYSHTGGYIGARGVQYRALGGSIFKKRGSDIVPAMLTPGEYVQNRRAVDYFGIDFMRKVNQLDVRGAMSELMARAGHMAGASRGTVVNNTYNNNQKVVINGADVSNAGYTFKKASRFVGAL